MNYEAPTVEIIEVQVERGFAGSLVIDDGYTTTDDIPVGDGSYPW